MNIAVSIQRVMTRGFPPMRVWRKRIISTYDGFVKFDDRELGYIMMHAVDIFEEIQTDTVFGKWEKAIRLLAEHADVFFAYVDADGFYRFVNKRYEEWIGLPREEFIGKHYSEIVGKETVERVKEHIHVALSGHGVKFEACLPYKHVGKRRVISEYIPDVDKKGKVKGFFSLVHDITGQVLSERDRSEREQRYKSLFDHNIDAVFSLDLEGRILSVNPACETISGYKNGELFGSSFEPLVVDEDKIRVLEYFRRAVKGESQAYETALIHKDGRRIDLKVKSVPIIVDDRVVGLYGIVKDESSEKKAQESLRNYMDRLEILNQTNNAILAGHWKKASGIVLDFLWEQFPSKRVSIKLFDFDEEFIKVFDIRLKGKAHPFAKKGLPPGAFGKGIEGLRQGRVYAVEDILTLPDPPEILSILKREDIRSFLAVPIMYQNKLIGTINSGRGQPGPFEEECISLFYEIAKQLSASFQHARAHEKLKDYTAHLESSVAKRTRWLETLYSVSRATSRAGDFLTVLDQILEQLLGSITCRATAIQLVTKGAESVMSFKGITPSISEALSGLLLDMGLMTHVIGGREPLSISHLRSFPLTRHLTFPDDIGSYVGVAIKMKGEVLGVLSVFGEADHQFGNQDFSLLSAIADHLAIVVEHKRLDGEAENAAVLEERHRMARDLHDALTQSLYSLRLLTEATQRMCEKGDVASLKEHLALMNTTVTSAIKETRSVVDHLRQPDLENMGLANALQQRLDCIKKVSGLKTRLQVKDISGLSFYEEKGLYFIAQEAINNVLKHAEATSLEINLVLQDRHVEMAIIDNGKGFDPVSRVNPLGMGIINMKERAKRRGGSLHLYSQPGAGTTVSAILPWEGFSQ